MSATVVELILGLLLCFGVILFFVISAITSRKKFGKVRSIYHPTFLAIMGAIVFAFWGIVLVFAFFMN